MAYRQFKRRDGGKGKIPYAEVKRFIEQEVGWKLLSEGYTNGRTQLDVVCPFGHKTGVTFDNFKTRQECPICEMLSVKNSNVLDLGKFYDVKKGYRILGLDQATQTSGFSLFENGKLIDYGTFHTGKKDLAERINDVRNWLLNMIEVSKPDFVLLEGIQFQNDIVVYEALAKNLGVLENTLYAKNIEYEIVQCQKWREQVALKGSSRIDLKANARKKVRDIYQQVCGEDEADAILIGHYGVKKKLKNKDEVIYAF